MDLSSEQAPEHPGAPNSEGLISPAQEGQRKRPLEGSQEKDGDKKRASRRILSCDSCRRLKCRCDYDPKFQTCHRCRTLRRECSLSVNAPAQSQRSPNDTAPSPESEERGPAITEIKDILQSILQRLGALEKSTASTSSLMRSPDWEQSPPTDENARTDMVDPADTDIHFAPAVVLRKTANQINGGFRRFVDHKNADLVDLGCITKEQANDLVLAFFTNRRHTLLMSDLSELSLGKNLRNTSPFLYSVCCLQGTRFTTESILNTALHGEIYEHVRHMLGQVLISSPLPVEEIYGILIMSLFAASSSKAPEYIDSWMLSGYCAQQAMLCISFSEITTRIKAGHASSADQRAIRLWASICLNHLHWAATTGRPPTIPLTYLRQCKNILKFYNATMQDAMLLAEVLLYSTLHGKLAQRSYLREDGECDEVLAWKRKWTYLFDLPNSSLLKISYFGAYLLLARLSLEECRRSSRNQTKPTLNDPDEPSPSVARPTIETGDLATFEKHASEFALSMIRTFLEMPASLRAALPEFHYVFLQYAGLIVAQYGTPTPNVSNKTLLDTMTSLEMTFRMLPYGAPVIKGALHRAVKRLGESRSANSSVQQSPNLSNESIQGDISFRPPADNDAFLPTPEDRNDVLRGVESFEACPTTMPARPQQPDLIPDPFAGDWVSGFPNIEDFFSGLYGVEFGGQYGASDADV